MSRREFGRGESLVASVSRRFLAVVAGVVLAAAIAVAGARPALATSHWQDGSGKTMSDAGILSNGKVVIGEFETDNPPKVKEKHWFKFKTSGRDSVYKVQIEVEPLEETVGCEVCASFFDSNGKKAPGNLKDTRINIYPMTRYNAELAKNSWYYFDVATIETYYTQKHDKFKVSVTEYPVLNKGTFVGSKIYSKYARVYWRKDLNATAYQVKYRSQNAKGTWGSWTTKTINGTMLKMYKLAPGKKFQVRVRPYRKGAGWNPATNKKSNYGEWSKTRTYRTKE